ncbi:MAG: SUMF1/EgtB/PvdO family nonheme iron enzyme [Kiritimatiellae bacterium]|nr:SUMF1/EgtB/PvdO family nonheme iron enzyme [Kiritimatiellia bacterium]
MSPTTAALVKGIKQNNIQQISDTIVDNGQLIVNTRIGAGVTPLHIAAALNKAEATLILLNSGAKIDAKTDGGFTALHWAAGKDASEAATVLLRHGADFNATTAKDITPLHWAANNNSTNVLALLLVSGANTSAKTVSGKTPLHWATAKKADAAAFILAYHMVTGQMTSEPDLTPSPQPIDYSPTTEPVITISTNTISPNNIGRSLTVPFGFGKTLNFTWIDSLNLWVGTYEISNLQYRRYVPTHNSQFYEELSLNHDNQPVVYVSWNDANNFCNWLNKNYHDKIPLGSKFRLPTSVEWEAIAKCGDNRVYPWGDAWPPIRGNLSDLTARKAFRHWQGIRLYDDGHAVTCPVDKSAHNEWGIYGMAGNVREWCQDWYNKGETLKIRHGGCWDFDTATGLKINSRGFDRPEVKYDTIGFRVVITPDQ